jgi:WD40 repeat protein
VWDAASGEELLTLSGHTDGVKHAAWSGDSSRILTVSRDGSAKVWDAASGEELLTLSGHRVIGDGTSGVYHAAWSGDDKRIVTANTDGTARIYFATIEGLLEVACQRSSRNMKHSEWERYMGSDVLYQRTCPNLPISPY